MKCAFKITGFSELANKRVLSISVTDEAGLKNDKCQIRLDDRDYALETPQKGLIFDVYLGYEETGLVKMGTFQLDEVKFMETPAKTMEISGMAGYQKDNEVKAPKQEPWDEKTLGEVLGAIASRNGYEADIHGDIAGIYYDHLDQEHESDQSFATRICDRHDAFVKFADGKMIVRPRDQPSGLVVVSKAALPQVSIGGLVITVPTSITATASVRSEYKKVTTYWHDNDTGKREEVFVGDGTPEHKVRKLFETKDKARKGGQAKFDQLKRGKGEITSMTGPGDPNIRADMKLVTQGFRPDINTTWKISSVTHTMDNGGYKFSLKAEQEI